MNKLQFTLLALVTISFLQAAQDPETISVVDRKKFLHAFRDYEHFVDTNGTIQVQIIELKKNNNNIQVQIGNDAQEGYYIDKNNSVYMPNYELLAPRLRRYDVTLKGKLRPTDHYFSVSYDEKNNKLVFTEIIE